MHSPSTSEVLRVTGCTIVTRAGLPAARVLARSYLEQHPEHDFRTVVLDGDDEPERGVAGQSWLTEASTDFLDLATALDAGELAAAMVPVVLRRLLDTSDVVLFLAPGTVVYGPLTDVVADAARHGLVLAPRLLTPLPSDGHQPDDEALAEAGALSSRFAAAGRDARPVLDLWADQARYDRAGPATLDVLPVLFAAQVLRDPGCNLSHWNAHERELVRAQDGTVSAAGRPLRFVDFDGYDPDTPWLLWTPARGRPRVLLSEHEVLRTLCDGYRDALSSARDRVSAAPYRFGSLPDGTPLRPALRRVFRDAWTAAHGSGNRRTAAPAHPFGAGGPAEFRDWLRSPASARESAAGVNRLCTGIWSHRTDLQVAFARPLDEHAAAFRAWCRRHGTVEEGIPEWALPAEPEPPRPPVREFGVNLAGNLTGELGIGEMGRIVHRTLAHAGVPMVSVVEEESLSCRTGVPAPADTGQPRFPVSILAVNADFTQLLLDAHPAAGAGRYRIGLWAWELADFPAWLHDGFALVDEVWTVSEFCREAIAAHAPPDIAVKRIPVPVPDPGTSPMPQRRPGDPVRFLFAFDFNSTAGRKNPLGLVGAFRHAFPGRTDVSLVIKATNGDLHVGAAERLRQAVADDPRISLLERYLSVAELDQLYADSDAYVSLHRSEGFGLTVAEAMIRGLPVAATGYSGTAEFLDDTVGWPVGYRLVEVGPGWHPYQPDGIWAEPDLERAAAALRQIADDPAEAARRGKAAREHLLRTRSVSAAADWMVSELTAAHETWLRRQSGPAPVPLARRALLRAARVLDRLRIRGSSPRPNPDRT
ncbi:glycosyltransferase family 4 protein [Actinophytocola sp.]|uniref:glycosyltransferase family 4 protein n=1 Tax=Actinophytocola sp. TaxID=1872138 RepID=UPI002D7E8011|nr:glycosyltransferase family 4 protein [Actinophytocola sp.]HET9143494.1 glycosyltransferase family 4 protein [Actinophytocola sp.]